MKIKRDFITNSSSTSFILTDSYTDTKDIATEIVNIIFEEWRLDGEINENYASQIQKNIIMLRKNENIMIPFSTNEETFIFRLQNGNFYIQTCNNHYWLHKFYINSNLSLTKKQERAFNKALFVNIENHVVDTADELLKLKYDLQLKKMRK